MLAPTSTGTHFCRKNNFEENAPRYYDCAKINRNCTYWFPRPSCSRWRCRGPIRGNGVPNSGTAYGCPSLKYETIFHTHQKVKFSSTVCGHNNCFLAIFHSAGVCVRVYTASFDVCVPITFLILPRKRRRRRRIRK